MKSYKDGTKVCELIIDEFGTEFTIQETLYVDKNGSYRLENENDNGKSWGYYIPKDLNTTPKRFEYNQDDYVGWNVKCFVFGEDCDDENIISNLWKEMKTVYNDYIQSEIKRYENEISRLTAKLFIV